MYRQNLKNHEKTRVCGELAYDHVAVVLPKLPDKNYSAKDQRARWVCFHIPNLWAKKGGTCNPTADISSLRHAAHFRVCRRLSRDFCSHAKIQEIMHKLTAASSLEQ
jgi:hypothetical protein